MTWSRERPSPVAVAVSAAWRSAARHATPCSTGSSAESTLMVSGAGCSVTRRSLRAVRAA